jgi:L-threonylcarbamoyladenylate synthase
MPAHYAPGTPLRLVPAAQLGPTLRALQAAGQVVAVLAMSPPPPDLTDSHWWWMPADVEAYARQLYAYLRAADASGSRCILIEQPPATDAWEAVRDRLERASAGAGRGEGPG